LKFKLNLDQVDEILSEFGVTLKAAKEAGAHLRSRPSRTGRKSPSQIEQENLEAVERGRDLDKIENPSEHVVLAAIRRSGEQIKFVENPSERLQLEALNIDYWRIEGIVKSIKNLTATAKMAAVKVKGAAIKEIPQPWSRELMLEAILQDGDVLEIIKTQHFKSDPPEDMCMVAIRQDPTAVRYLDAPTEEMQLEAVRANGNVLENLPKASPQVKLEAVRQQGAAVRFIKNPSLELQLEAVKQAPAAIFHIENPSEEVQLAAVRIDPGALGHIAQPTPAVMLEAFSANGMLANKPDLTDEMKLAAVRQNGMALEFFKYTASEELETAAVKQNWRAIEFVMNPSEAVLREFLTHWITDTVMKA